MPVGVIYSCLVNFAIFCALLPFVAPFPLKSDVQYPVFFVCTIIIIIDLYRRNISLNKFELYFLFVVVLSLFYINPFVSYSYIIKKRVGLLFGFILFYVFRRYAYLLSAKTVIFAVFINLFGVLFHLISPGTFMFIAEMFTRKIYNYSQSSGSRGVSAFSAEPGFLGAMSVIFILISYHLYVNRKMKKKQFYLITIISIFMAFASSSGTASLFLVVLCMSIIVFHKNSLSKKTIIVSITILFTYLLIYHSGLSGRGLSILQKLIEDPYQVFVLDPPVAIRGISLAVGVESLLQGNIFGHGVGTLSYVASGILSSTIFEVLFHDVILHVGGLVSAFSQYTVELGIWFIALIIYIYSNSINKRYAYVTRSITVLLLIASYSILFPPLWLLLAITDRNYRSNTNYYVFRSAHN